MKKLLQNHPGTPQFPVSGWGLVCSLIRAGRREELRSRLPKAVVNTYDISIYLLFCFVVLFLVALTDPTFITIFQGFVARFQISIIVFLGIIFLSWIVFFIWLEGDPAREQYRYYQEANREFLDVQKRQVLRLDITQRFDCGFWTETLESCPLISLVKDPNQYRWMYLMNPEEHQHQLYEDWGIESREDCLTIIEQLFGGMHSAYFKNALASSDTEDLVIQLASLTQIAGHQIEQTTQPRNQRPPSLIWGFDLWRIIPVVSLSHASGYITEEEAWGILLSAADIVYEMFGSYDEFNASYRLGHAFWCRNVEMTQKRLQEFLNYKQHCHWPVAQLPWPEPKGVPLTTAMRTGEFPERIQETLKEL